jgi:hypothetical protein
MFSLRAWSQPSVPSRHLCDASFDDGDRID